MKTFPAVVITIYFEQCSPLTASREDDTDVINATREQERLSCLYTAYDDISRMFVIMEHLLYLDVITVQQIPIKTFNWHLSKYWTPR